MASTDEPPRRSFLFSFGLDKLGLLALKAPYVSAALIALLTALAIVGVSRMKVDDSLSELFRTDTKEFRQYEEIDRRFPSSEYDVLVVIEGPDLLKKAQLEAFRNVAVELQLTDGVGGIVSMMSARGKPDESGYAPPVVPDDLPEAGPEYDAIIGSLKSNDIVKGKFLSEDGTLAMIVIALDRAMVEQKTAKVVIGGIKDAIDQQLKDSGLTAKLTGAPVMQLEIRNAVERDRLVYNGLGFLVGFAVAYLFFRRLSLTLIAVLGPTIAILWTLGRHRRARLPAQSVRQRHHATDPGVGLLGLDASRVCDPARYPARRRPYSGGEECRARRGARLLADGHERRAGHTLVLVRGIGADPNLRQGGADGGRHFLHRGRRGGADAGGAAHSKGRAALKPTPMATRRAAWAYCSA